MWPRRMTKRAVSLGWIAKRTAKATDPERLLAVGERAAQKARMAGWKGQQRTSNKWWTLSQGTDLQRARLAPPTKAPDIDFSTIRPEQFQYGPAMSGRAAAVEQARPVRFAIGSESVPAGVRTGAIPIGPTAGTSALPVRSVKEPAPIASRKPQKAPALLAKAASSISLWALADELEKIGKKMLRSR